MKNCDGQFIVNFLHDPNGQACHINEQGVINAKYKHTAHVLTSVLMTLEGRTKSKDTNASERII